MCLYKVVRDERDTNVAIVSSDPNEADLAKEPAVLH
jgi:hypothetical protein